MTEIEQQPLMSAFLATRQQSIDICKPLAIEDYGLQAAAFSSPPKWHLAHTSWFFETFILKPFVEDYQVFHPAYEVLFNSYYNAVGEQFPRPQRGLLSRPTVLEIMDYREHINNAMSILLMDPSNPNREDIVKRCQLGIQHEKQHQELFFTDLKYSLSINPLYPVYNSLPEPTYEADPVELQWLSFTGGLVEFGTDANVHNDDNAFTFDNESPLHKVHLEPFVLANRLVTNGEFQAFIDDGGYQCSKLWLADGWALVQEKQWQKPLYWIDKDGQSMEFTLHGLQTRKANQPVSHLSAYEADAYANWANARLPTEFEWEHAACQQTFSHQVSDDRHPQSARVTDTDEQPLLQLYDGCWQWTSSAYRPYPGFEISEGAIGEYNGKFMCNQWVLRGGSCVSPEEHLRPTYRNFFYPADRWQFSGLRLAMNCR